MTQQINESSIRNITVEMDYIEKRINRLTDKDKLKQYKKLRKRLTELCSKLNDATIDKVLEIKEGEK